MLRALWSRPFDVSSILPPTANTGPRVYMLTFGYSADEALEPSDFALCQRIAEQQRQSTIRCNSMLSPTSDIEQIHVE